jgi:hypothetical protein
MLDGVRAPVVEGERRLGLAASRLSGGRCVAGWTMMCSEFGNRPHSTLCVVWAKSTLTLLLCVHVGIHNFFIATFNFISRHN